MDCELTPLFSFIYKGKLDNKFTEHELDPFFVGYSDETPKFDVTEVYDHKYV